MKNNLLQDLEAILFLIGMTITLVILTRCTSIGNNTEKPIPLANDTERFRYLSILIKECNDSLIVHGNTGDTIKMKSDYGLVQSLEQNRLLLLRRVLDYYKSPIADEIEIDTLNKMVRWKDEILFHQGDCINHNKFLTGVILNNKYLQDDAGATMVLGYFRDGMHFVKIRDIKKIRCEDIQKDFKAEARIYINKLNRKRK